jgi:hypothetical protein
VERHRRWWTEIITGAYRAGEPAVVDTIARWQPLGVTFEDLLEAVQTMEPEACRTWLAGLERRWLEGDEPA